jgi:hypothetical protein
VDQLLIRGHWSGTSSGDCSAGSAARRRVLRRASDEPDVTLKRRGLGGCERQRLPCPSCGDIVGTAMTHTQDWAASLTQVGFGRKRRKHRSKHETSM